MNEIDKLPNICSFCDEGITSFAYTCRYCGNKFCQKHRLPEKHDCSGEPKRPV